MPNIEIHGLSGDEAQTIEDKIFELFEYSDFINDMVVEIVPSFVHNKERVYQPYLRFRNTDSTQDEKTIKGLLKLGMDLEPPERLNFVSGRHVSAVPDAAAMLPASTVIVLPLAS